MRGSSRASFACARTARSMPRASTDEQARRPARQRRAGALHGPQAARAPQGADVAPPPGRRPRAAALVAFAIFLATVGFGGAVAFTAGCDLSSLQPVSIDQN